MIYDHGASLYQIRTFCQMEPTMLSLDLKKIIDMNGLRKLHLYDNDFSQVVNKRKLKICLFKT